MRYLLLLLCFCARSDWKSDHVIYWYNNTHPTVALTTNTLPGIDHASGSVTAVQIGDQTGILPAQCHGFISDGVCGGSIQDCQWGRITNNLVIDAYLFSTCRPLTNGITKVVTNLAIGSAVVIFSLSDKTWYSGGLVLQNFEQTAGFKTDFDDGSSGFFYTLVTTTGGAPTTGKSGSLVFTTGGVFVGSVSGLDAGVNFSIMALYPNGVVYGTSSGGAAGLAALFNSDPDR